MKQSRVLVGLSGGVDSSVAAYLLKEQGHEVIGAFMKNWHDTSVTISDQCPWAEDSADALMVAQQLGIPFFTFDFSEVYRERIVDYMFKNYAAGVTPNPDVLCNREIKFQEFLQAAEKLGADYVATGHYARKSVQEIDGNAVYSLLAGVDGNKDQSYFLCQLTQHQLQKALFPLGELRKEEVRRIALEQQFATAEKKDSQGLCFIGKVRLPEFLQQQLKPRRGTIIRLEADDVLQAVRTPDLPDQSEWHLLSDEQLDQLCSPAHFDVSSGHVAGHHNGAYYYTVGQRKGLNVGGTPEPLYVVHTDVKENIVFVGMGQNHPALFRQGIFIPSDEVHWIRDDLRLSCGNHAAYLARIRYRQPLFPVMLIMRSKGLYVLFEEKQKGVAAGQFAAWYRNDECIGSGPISQ